MTKHVAAIGLEAASLQPLLSRLGGDAEVASTTATSLASAASASAFDALASHATEHPADFLAAALAALKPGGVLLLREPVTSRSEDELRSALLFSGFGSIELSAVDGVHEVYAHKPEWAVGATSTLKRKPAATAAAATVWKLDADEDGDLIDEDSLVSLAGVTKKPVADDCEVGPGKMKACKNCSCGRAEILASSESQGAPAAADTAEAPKSACGSCYLGDAFRCATCPYLGKPAFKPGERVQFEV